MVRVHPSFSGKSSPSYANQYCSASAGQAAAHESAMMKINSRFIAILLVRTAFASRCTATPAARSGNYDGPYPIIGAASRRRIGVNAWNMSEKPAARGPNVSHWSGPPESSMSLHWKLLSVPIRT